MPTGIKMVNTTDARKQDTDCILELIHAPTSSVFTVYSGGGARYMNANGAKHNVAYFICRKTRLLKIWKLHR